ncbi:MAG: HAMP domain-containing sensor histidine kinase [Actinomycetota bacterium]|nr:HAMP domain-containing sensor histidine kinase [Actinomycetota bacterium]
MPSRGRPRLPGIRVQTTVIAVLVVGLSVSLAMAALLWTARGSFTDQITASAEARVQDIALLAKAGSVPHPVPGRGEDQLVQVFDAGGAVTASSASIEGQAPLVDIQLAPGESRTYTVPSLLESGGENGEAGEGGADPGVAFLVSAIGVASPAGPVTVMVAGSLDPVQQMVDVLQPRLEIGLPLILLIVGATVWALTGRALRPVEAIRREAEEISAASLERRVPEPRTSDEIGRLADTMNRMLDRLESSARVQRRFVSDASHELKSPVASIRTMLDVARRRHPADLNAFIDDLAAEDRRLEHLVGDLLALARYDESMRPAHPVDVDLDDVVLGEVAVITKSSEIRIDISGVHPARLQAELGSMESLVRNLLGNAVRHAASTVWVTVDVREDMIVFTVSDDGPGVPPEDRERIFDRFVRLDEARVHEDGGTGLGLALCRVIAHSLRGDVRVADPLHGGATFEVTLPLHSPS